MNTNQSIKTDDQFLYFPVVKTWLYCFYNHNKDKNNAHQNKSHMPRSYIQ